MIRKKIVLIVSVIVVIGGALACVNTFMNYSKKQTDAYVNQTITQVQTDIKNDNLSAAQTAIDNLKARVNTNQSSKIKKQIDDLTTQLIQKQNSDKTKTDLANIASLIQKGSLSEASFEIEKLEGENISDADKVTLSKDKDLLENAKQQQQSTVVEKNAMNALSGLMQDQEYEKANNYIENLDTTGFSKENLATIATYTKQIQQYQNTFNIDDFKVPATQITGLYKEAFPASTDTVSVSSTIPVYFIGSTPVYKVTTSSAKNPVVYLLADGTNVNATAFTTALSNKNLYIVTDSKKDFATSIPSDVSN